MPVSRRGWARRAEPGGSSSGGERRVHFPPLQQRAPSDYEVHPASVRGMRTGRRSLCSPVPSSARGVMPDQAVVAESAGVAVGRLAQSTSREIAPLGDMETTTAV